MTPRKAKFLARFLANGRNATEAAKHVGVSDASAAEMGSRWLKTVEIQDQLQRSNEKIIEQGELTAADVLKAWGRILRFDMRKLYDENGSPRPLKDLDDDTALALASLEVEAETDKHGKLYKFRGFSKPEVARDAARHFGMYEADNAQIGQSYADLVLAAQRKREGKR